MHRPFQITKCTREGQKPRCKKEVLVSVQQSERGFVISVHNEEWRMTLTLLSGSFSLACLIAENLPEPILRRELYALGFRVEKQVDA